MAEYSLEKVNIVDVKVTRYENNFYSDLYIKPTNNQKCTLFL